VPEKEKPYYFFKESGQLVKVYYVDILYAQSDKDYIQLITKTRKIMIYMTMYQMAKILPSSIFMRIHRSFIINKQYIEVIGKTTLQVAGQLIPVGRSYAIQASQLRLRE